MSQTDTRPISTATIMRSAAFKAGVEDVRTGQPARFDDYVEWEYERGRQFAVLAPRSMPLRLNGKLNPRAIALLEDAFDREDIR